MFEERFLDWSEKPRNKFISNLKKSGFDYDDITEAVITYHACSKNEKDSLLFPVLIRVLARAGLIQNQLEFSQQMPRHQPLSLMKDRGGNKIIVNLLGGDYRYSVNPLYFEELKEKYLTDKHLHFLANKPLPEIKDDERLIGLNNLNLSSEKGLPSKLIPELIQEANYNYHWKFYNSCALICRRICEILIVEALEEYNSSNPNNQTKIKDNNGDYLGLGKLIGQFKTCKIKGVDKNLKTCLDNVKAYGDIGAHHQFVSVGKEQIEGIRPNITMTINVLLQIGDFFKEDDSN